MASSLLLQNGSKCLESPVAEVQVYVRHGPELSATSSALSRSPPCCSTSPLDLRTSGTLLSIQILWIRFSIDFHSICIEQHTFPLLVPQRHSKRLIPSLLRKTHNSLLSCPSVAHLAAAPSSDTSPRLSRHTSSKLQKEKE